MPPEEARWAEIPTTVPARREASAHVALGIALTVVAPLALTIVAVLRTIVGHHAIAGAAAWTATERSHDRPRSSRVLARGTRPTSAAVGRRRRLLIAACVLVAAQLGGLPEGIARQLSGGRDALAQPFRLVIERTARADDPLPDLDHPVPPDLEASTLPAGDAGRALAGSGWWNGQHFPQAQSWVFSPTGAWRTSNPYRVLDFAALGMNVADGYRPSWSAPECACRRLRVWIYGGSTAFGLQQRDDHTIASYLARAAHRDGLVLDVENRGLPGQVHWEEAERFALDLSVDEAPDLVVFYDGVNEAWAASTLARMGVDVIAPTVGPTNADVWWNTGRSLRTPPDAPRGARFIGHRSTDPPTRQMTAELTLERYDRARTLSAAIAAQHRIPVRYAWQPTRFSRALVAGEPHGDAHYETEGRAMDQLLKQGLAPDVIDLTDALDGTRAPIFTDDAHHNEAGARLIAEALYLHLADALREVEASNGQDP